MTVGIAHSSLFLSRPNLWLLLSLLWLSIGDALAAKPKVLVIQSYHAGYEWQANYSRALHDTLAPLAELEFFEIDSKRLPEVQYRAAADQAWERYQQLGPDLVIIGDDNALQLLGPKLATTATPVVYLGINNNPRHYLPSRPDNISGVLERPLLRRSILHLHRLLNGSLKRVLVLFDNGTTSRTVWEEEFASMPSRQVGPVHAQIELLGDYGRWQQTVEQAKAQGFDAIVIGLYQTLVDEQGRHVPDQQVINWTSEASPLPLFAFWRFAVGPQMTIGGLVLDGYSQGSEAASIAREVLEGGNLPVIPQSSGEGRFVFSRSQLQRWQLALPPSVAEQAVLVP
ncbi:sugar ABC transporter [Motiliproteus coralliicola]|uniref:Sugar ABC transporter n=1 Tax=Motiliproteus coralliicola TaxID=2283196 RepID=A0A369WE47_9GAMM|nr:sugar ABC transporter [Motiliproteus coralliicola]RDE18896.1 sugar ABC transporter [Motiliproteus coralliicola]